MSKPVPVNRGGQLLLQALDAAGLTLNGYSASRKLGPPEDLHPIGGGVLSRIIRGKRDCSREIAIALFEDFEIPVEAWDQKPLGRPRESAAA